ncbi:MAG: cell division protein ZapB [Spirochaetaceae bacterium]|jgi:hypothetical protein|nr:cell division protein ZapB [Spirochaetaceae bacterium]
MVSIEQVRLLESRVIKAIAYVDQVNEENALLKSKLGDCQKRVEELEVLIQRFREDQGKIEEGIISALNRLNKFEDDMGGGSSGAKAEVHAPPHRPAAPVTQSAAPPEEKQADFEAPLETEFDDEPAAEEQEEEKESFPDLGIF